MLGFCKYVCSHGGTHTFTWTTHIHTHTHTHTHIVMKSSHTTHAMCMHTHRLTWRDSHLDTHTQTHTHTHKHTHTHTHTPTHTCMHCLKTYATNNICTRPLTYHPHPRTPHPTHTQDSDTSIQTHSYSHGPHLTQLGSS